MKKTIWAIPIKRVALIKFFEGMIPFKNIYFVIHASIPILQFF